MLQETDLSASAIEGGLEQPAILLDKTNLVFNLERPSSKIKAVLNHILRHIPDDDKVIVVSQWSSVLDKEMDLFALLRFLRCSPFNELINFKIWVGNGNFEAQAQTLLQTLMLRRTKANLQAAKQIKLPAKEIKVVGVELNTAEMNVYQEVMRVLQLQFIGYLTQKSVVVDENLSKPHAQVAAAHGQVIRPAHILTLLLRLRQICCHPGLIEAVRYQLFSF